MTYVWRGVAATGLSCVLVASVVLGSATPAGAHVGGGAALGEGGGRGHEGGGGGRREGEKVTRVHVWSLAKTRAGTGPNVRLLCSSYPASVG